MRPLTGAALGAGVLLNIVLLTTTAAASDATWLSTAIVAGPVAGTFDFSDNANWNGGAVPTGTALFGASTTTALSFSANASIDGWTFAAGAPAYTFTIDGHTAVFNGAGIIANGARVSITSNLGMQFANGSTAGSASIINNGLLLFTGTATAGSADIVNNSDLRFYNFSTAGNASITNNVSGAVDFSSTAGPGIDNKVSAGSVAGAGAYYLGANQFTVGGNNLSTAVSGVISDCGTGASCVVAGASGGALVKIGSGTLTLSGTNTYTGGTTLAGGAISVAQDASLGDLAGALTFDGGALQVTGTTFTSTSRTINWGANGGGFDIADAANTFTLSQALTGTGGLTKLGLGTLTISGSTDYSGATQVMAGTLQAGSIGALSSNSDFTIAAGATLDLNRSFQFIGSLSGAGTVTNSAGGPATLIVGGTSVSTTFSGTITDGPGGPVALWVGGFGTSGTFTLTGNNTYSGGTVICSCWALQLGNGGTTGSIAGDVTNGGTLILNRSNGYTFGGVISDDNSDPGKVVQAGSGTTTLTGLNTYSGGTFVNAGTLQIGGAGTLGNTGAATTVAGGTLDLGGTTQTQNGGVSLTSGAIINGTLVSSAPFDLRAGTIGATLAGTGGVTKVGTGRVNITGTEAYTGATTVNGGTLSVNGDITSSSSVTVNAGGTLGGNGFVGNTTVNGGTLSPGNSVGLLTVAGNLVLTSAASYMVEVSSASADRVNVTGTATLGGATVNASFTGSFLSKQYTILNATGGISGTFGSLVSSNLPATVSSSLSYDANDVYLNFKLSFGPSGLNINQQNVGNALTGYFNRSGGIPLAFAALTPAGLTQVSGELATGTQQATFDAMNLFLGVLTDPTVSGRGFGAAAPGVASFTDPALAYAGQKRPGAERDAFALITKAVPRAKAFETRWNVWATGFGGSRNTDGNAALGASDASASVGGVAVGADVLLSPTSVAGFALSGGATSFSVSNAGSGRSDLFQAGAYVRHTAASAYLTAALAYGWQDVTTDRGVTVAGIDLLHADFKTNSYSARIEGGNRYVLPWIDGGIGITPYAAAQVTALDLPGYAEAVNGGANTFALNYSSKTVTAPRTELGLRSDKSFAVADAVLTLRGRAAWAHDFNTDRNIAAVFQSLPGAAFVVSGGAASRDSALTTAAAEMRFASGISLAAAFEGEFSGASRSYAGKGVARYSW